MGLFRFTGKFLNQQRFCVFIITCRTVLKNVKSYKEMMIFYNVFYKIRQGQAFFENKKLSRML